MSSKKERFEKYYLGLDIGTDSVGWCVTDKDYNILKFNGKAMWGIRLFDEASSSADRRMFRTGRRRLQRRKQRIALLEELFAEEITKVDPVFFMRMKESFFLEEDKKPQVKQRYSLFADKTYTDVDYHKEFPTIYHLRYALMKHEKKYDIRLYYLAISHFMKHRGHFLLQGDVSEATSFEVVYKSLHDYIDENMDGIGFSCNDLSGLASLLGDRKIGRTDKKRMIVDLFEQGNEAVQQKEILAALCGSKVKLEKLFGDESLKDAEITGFSFAEGIDDDKEAKLFATLGERFELISRMKAVYDWSVLTKILSGSKSISEAQIQSYDKHGSDLKLLKRLVRKYIPKEYKEIFNSKEVSNNYCAYVGHTLVKRETEQKEFCDYIKKKFLKVENDDKDLANLRDELERGTFMPKQVMKSNSAVPYQVHRQDLRKILDNLGKDYPSLALKDESGLSVCDKILRIFEFRIPYYVGPLNNHHSKKGGNSWVIRKRQGRVTPWNFDEMVDTKASAEAFMMRLTNKCTYLTGEDVLPKDSLLYSKYMVLNELNNIRINGNRLDVGIKQQVYEELFMKGKGQLSLKKLKVWLIKENYACDEDQISGIDETFKAKLKSYQDFMNIIGTRVNTEPSMVDDIIRNILIFGEDKKLLSERIKEKFGDRLNDDEIRKISRLSYSGWGRLSYKLLNEITDVDHETGEIRTVIQAMWDGQENLMELLSSGHEYMERIREINATTEGRTKDICYELVQDSYASPSVKRGIWQTLLIIKEIQKITGHNPNRVFVEVARAKEDNPKRKESRQARLLSLYKNIKDESRDWIKEIGAHAERDFASKKLYLYYTQMGRDMYSGEPIDLEDLMKDTYDIDHIFPQSKTKDDSIINNLVLVRSEYNRDKDNVYPIPSKYRQYELWKLLKDKELISKEKYNRLIRKEELSDEELAGFIGRQLVETRQTTKVVTQILEQTMPETKIVYSKANVVSDFRKENDFIKCRSVNDYHHAKDAYLNIVVGNVYYTKFTDDPVKYIKNAHKEPGRAKYSLNRMFEYDVERGGVTAWIAGESGSISTVKKYMSKNNILFTRYATEKRGGFYDQNLLKKGSGQLMPIKGSDQRYNTEKYGGYKNPGINHFMLVESDGKKGRIRTIEGVPVYLNSANKEIIKDFCESELGLRNPDIRCPEIKINSLIKIDGYPMHISGKSNARIVVKNAVQLCLSSRQEKLLHDIDKVVDRIKENRNYTIDVHDGITDDELVGLYETLTEKLNTIYKKRHSSQISVIENGKEIFVKMSKEEKVKLIYEFLHLFQCNAIASDFSKIGGASRAGVLVVGNEVSKFKDVRLITQSPTGLFETEIDLLSL
jgi:CRISPR-associated endonuclease Csn1